VLQFFFSHINRYSSTTRRRPHVIQTQTQCLYKDGPKLKRTVYQCHTRPHHYSHSPQTDRYPKGQLMRHASSSLEEPDTQEDSLMRHASSSPTAPQIDITTPYEDIPYPDGTTLQRQFNDYTRLQDTLGYIPSTIEDHKKMLDIQKHSSAIAYTRIASSSRTLYPDVTSHHMTPSTVTFLDSHHIACDPETHVDDIIRSNSRPLMPRHP
jgi:hypothetical protein